MLSANTVHVNRPNGARHSTRPTTPSNTPDTSSVAIHASPENGAYGFERPVKDLNASRGFP